MRFAELKNTDETFTYIHAETDELMFICVSAVNRWARKTFLEVKRVAVQDHLAEFIVNNNNVKPENADKTTDEKLKQPITLIDWGDGFQSMIDGNHRYVRAYRKGMDSLPAWFVPIEDARQFMIEDLPADMEAFLRADVKAGVIA